MLQQPASDKVSRKWKPWAHNALAADLANHLRANPATLAWVDMQLGPSGSVRPDVYVIPRSYSNFRPLAYEAKVSMSDFRKDVTSGKWQNYLDFACGVIFAAPAGMLTKDDVPQECGLIVRHDEVWRTVKKPTLRVLPTLDVFAWVKLLIDGVEREADRRRPPLRKAGELHPWQAEQQLRKKHGEKLAQLVSMAIRSEDALHAMIERHRAAAENLSDEIRKMDDRVHRNIETNRRTIDSHLQLLAGELGLPADASQEQLIESLRAARNRLVGDREIQRIRRLFERICRDAQEGAEPLPGQPPCKVQAP